MIPPPPTGQGPIDPRGAFAPPPAPGGAGGAPPNLGQPPMPSMGQTPMWPMPYPPKRRGGTWKWVVIIVLLLLLIGSVIMNFALAAAAGVALGYGGGNETVITSGDSKQTIAVIPLTGLIDGTSEQHFSEMIDRAEQNTDVKAVVIRIDTPGGEVGASDEIFHRIQRFKDNRKIPVVISMGSLATSGGYYVACAGDYLFAEQTTDTGNIGVLMPGFNFSALMNRWGITDQTVVSTGTPFKEVGSPFATTKPAGEAYLQNLVDGAFNRFKQVVTLGRGKKLTESIDTIANGKVYLASEAKTLGLVDEIGYLNNATHYAATTASLGDPQIVRYEEPASILKSLLLGSASTGRPQAGGADAINVNVDSEAFNRLASPRLMYMWRP